MRIAAEQLVAALTPNYLSESSYDQAELNLGRAWIVSDDFAQPHFDAIRPFAEATSFGVNQIFSINFSTTVNYVFGVEASTTASATRRVHLWSTNRKTGVRTWQGFITLTLATATAHTVRDFKIDRKVESTGTVGVSGTAVTGSGTQFAANKVAVGARIGFGSTNPSQITEWFRVSARGSDTSITLDRTAGTITSGTAYVIEEFRPVYVATNATTTNGGIHYAKGVSIEDFLPGGTTIALAVSTDDQKAVYWIKDASTVTLTVACGAACDFDNATPTNLDTYVLHSPGAAQYRVFKFNLRAGLTVASGASVSAFVLQTGTQAVTGTISQNANLILANAGHGPGSGVSSLYCVTTTTINRIALANVTNGNTTFVSDTISETPPGGVGTYTATATLNTIEYMPAPLDVFVVGTTNASGAAYLTKFNSSGVPYDRKFGINSYYNEQTTKDTGHPIIFSNGAAVCFTNAGGNRLFVCRQGTTAPLHQVFIIPVGCDWEFAGDTQGRLIFPPIATPNCEKFARVFLIRRDYMGSDALGKTTEAARILARTADFSSETDSWQVVDFTGDISAFGGASEIQFAVEVKTCGDHCSVPEIVGVCVVYDDNTTDSHYAFSADKSSAALKQFTWRFKTAFGGTVPELRVSIYDDVNGGLLVTDTSEDMAAGTWEKSTNGGGSWSSYNSTDKANETTYIRFTPDSLADNVTVAAYLTQA
ncbi:MAG TPA: hypothetical protein PLX39_15530 [Pyrinomonadaceae bacterium]|nr:hypothetical protein [Pyrinomonadaceae bacterium]